MEIFFENHHIEKLCSMPKVAQRELGTDDTKKLRARLTEIAGVENLAELMNVPQAGCHPLKQDRKGQFAVNLKHPRRLVFVPGEEPVPQKPDGSYDLNEIRSVILIEVGVDYHD